MKWWDKGQIGLCIATAVITGTVLGMIQGGLLIYHLRPLDFPAGGRFLYLLYFIGMYVLVSSGVGLLIGVLNAPKHKILLTLIGLAGELFLICFCLSKIKWVAIGDPLLYRLAPFYRKLDKYTLYSVNYFAVLFLFGFIVYHFLKKESTLAKNLKKISLCLPIIFLCTCLAIRNINTAKAEEALGPTTGTVSTLSPMGKDYNVILIVVDALRADHLSCYGYPRLTSPNIDEFAGKSARFTNAITQKTRTAPSMASMLTGTYPYIHGVDKGEPLPKDAVTIGEVLRKYGYHTASVVSNGHLGYEFNFDKGFDKVFEVWNYGPNSPENGKRYAIAENVNKSAFPWLEENCRDKFFLYIHYIDPHSKYMPPPPYNQTFVNDKFYGKFKDVKVEVGDSYATFYNKISKFPVLEGPNRADLDYYISQYDGEIRYCDEHIGKLFAKIRELGLDKNTLIILTADHGEDLTEHSVYFCHGLLAYETSANIPLIISSPPNFGPKIIDSVAEEIDIFPSILDFLGLKQEKTLQGESLLPPICAKNGEGRSKEYGFVEGNYKNKIITGIRTKDWKLLYKPYLLFSQEIKEDPEDHDTLDLAAVYNPSIIWKSLFYLCAIEVNNYENYNMMYELYNIKADRDEQKNLYLARPDIATPLRERLMARLKEHPRRFAQDTIKPKDSSLVRNLKALGYLQ